MLFDNIIYQEGNAYEEMKGDDTWDKFWKDDFLKFPIMKNNFPDKEQEHYRNWWKQKIQKIKKSWDEGKEYKTEPIPPMP